MNFAESLQRAMDARDVTQRELAQMVGVSQGIVNSWLKGARVPTVTVAMNIADALDCSLDALLGVRKVKKHG